MASAKRGSKQKRGRTALPFLGAAGASLAMAGGASASAVPPENLPAQKAVPHPVVVLGEEELSDVSLATFYVLDQEDQAYLGVKVAQRCGGCRGCGGRGCAAARCAAARCAVARCGGRCAVARCRCGVGVVGCARCGCSCSGCSGVCWSWLVTGWIWVC